MKSVRRQALYENIIYSILWLIIYIAPVLSSINRGYFSWKWTMLDWESTIPLLLIFILNNDVLLPELLIKKRYVGYFACAIGISIAFIIISDITFDKIRAERIKDLVPPRVEVPRIDKADTVPLPPINKQRVKPHPDSLKRNFMPRPFRGPLFNNFLIAILIIGFNIAVKLLFKTIRDDEHLKELEKQHLEMELGRLKDQINPHFFMNTLNNIHSLIDINSEKAKESIIDLSKIMRYVLYDSSNSAISLEKEILFLNKYIELMRIRYTEKVSISLKTPEKIPEVTIPPLLFISFVENAFIHGVSYNRNTNIGIEISINGDELNFEVTNNYDMVEGRPATTKGGIGIENTRKRLDLLYHNDYNLNIDSDNSIFKVKMNIPLII